MAFTIFYDGKCPLCVKEMQHLIRKDKENNLQFENIHAGDFSRKFPDLDINELDARIHGIDENGKLYIGLDVTHKAWSLVGVGWLYAPLRWPLLRWFADKAYLVFAKHRYKLSFWITGKKRCEDNCEIKLK
ncbi:thiol-disulfide oxidoreductase DCC family protein [Agaribacter flavus]|uniref:Thiol-disulfide oxidoreductase DCC family protein n=1 Tax=Agaribacter flavus TaxID=1902781 RepID=A0ABV7FP65_9ALTE